MKVPKRINVLKLAQLVRTTLMHNVTFGGTWVDFKTKMYKVGADLLGFVERHHTDWFDHNDDAIKELLETKRFHHESLLRKPSIACSAPGKTFKEHKATLQRVLRKMKNDWWNKISNEVQSAFDKSDSKTLYSLLHQAIGPKSSPVVPMKSMDGNSTIKDPEGILKRWSEHFTKLFFNPSVVDEILPQMSIKQISNF